MRKKVIIRGLLGFPIGIAAGFIIMMIISMGLGDGRYLPCTPSLIKMVGNELGATALQAGLCGLIGACFSMASVIWEIEKWGIAKQTGLYFLVTALTMLPIAYFTGWMEHTLLGFLMYFSLFVIIFLGMWGVQYAVWKNKIRKFNEKLKTLS